MSDRNYFFTHIERGLRAVNGICELSLGGNINKLEKYGGKMNPKTIIFFTIFVLVMSNILAFPGWQTGTHEGTPGLEFRRLGSTLNVEVRVGTASSSNMNIPASVNVQGINYNVTTIAINGFHGVSSMTAVTLPNSLRNIEEGAFRFSGLASITIPNSVTTIGSDAFSGCSNLSSVTIGSGVTSFGSWVFGDSWNIRDFNINSNIPNNPDFGGPNIRTIVIGDNVTNIGNSAFSGSSSLSSLTIGNSVTHIGHNAFLGSSALASVILPNSLRNIGEGAFRFSGLASITIPNSVTTIDSDAFSGCSNLRSVTIGSGVTSFGSWVFGDSWNIMHFNINSNIPGHLYGGNNLTTVVIGRNVLTIGNSAFNNSHQSMTIYTEHLSQPSGWAPQWNNNNRPVIWGYNIPTQLTATSGIDRINLSWTIPNLPTVITLAGFRIEKRIGTGSWTILEDDIPATARTFVDNEVSTGYAYWYRIIAKYINPVNESVPSNIVGPVSLLIPSIVISSNGLAHLKVNQTLNNATIIYTLSNGTFASTINPENFIVSNLPTGLVAGTASRTGDTVVTISVTGIPTTHTTTPADITFPSTIAMTNVVGATNPVSVTGSVVTSAVAKGDGSAVSGPPTLSGEPTQNSITVNIITIPNNPGDQTVEYAISTSTTTPTNGWQSESTFNDLNANTGYRVFARSSQNANWNAGTAQMSAMISTIPPPSIVATVTGLTNLKVGQAVSGASVLYTLSHASYATPISASHFDISGLPPGLTADTAIRTSNTIVTVSISGTPTTFNTNITNITRPNSIPASNVTGATTAITVTGTLTASAVAKGDGSAVSGPPTLSGEPTQNSITVYIITVPDNPGDQTVEYAISTSTTTPTTGWQNQTTFTGLSDDTVYFVFARSAANSNWNEGTAQRSAPISTKTVSTEDESMLPFVTRLHANFPNPFNPETTIEFALKTDEHVLIEIYNNKGQKVNTLINTSMRAGIHQIVWNGRDESGNKVGSGIYVYRMIAGEHISIKRMLLMK